MCGLVPNKYSRCALNVDLQGVKIAELLQNSWMEIGGIMGRSLAHLGGGNEDLAGLGRAQVAHDAHELGGLCARLLRLRHVHVHLVPVKVRVVGVAHALVEAECPAET